MKRRECPQCALRFKGKARPLVEGSRKPVVTCPRCGHMIEVEDDDGV